MLIHLVKPGELLWQIAAYYRVPIEQIIYGKANTFINNF